MIDYKKHKLKFNPYLEKLYQSDKAMIIYKVQDGYNIYTDFSKKIILNNKNIKSFLTKKNKKKSKDTDLFIGFFGYELLNNLIDVKIPKQKNLNFPKGIFYKPEKKIKLSNKLNYDFENFKSGNFKYKSRKALYLCCPSHNLYSVLFFILISDT